MHHGSLFLAGLVALQSRTVQSLPWPISVFERQSPPAEEPDVTELGFVRKWAAIGDSYSAGIGSGAKLSDSGKCGRYDNSYPMLLQRYEEMPTNPAPTMEYLSCSGATSPEILERQVSTLGTGYDLITLSSGGNDVGLVDILNACIYQWFASTGDKGCDEQLTKTEGLIKDTLPGNYDALTAALKSKLNTNRKVFWTGYARFFDDASTNCDSVTWAFWFNLIQKNFITQARRKRMNDLVISVNAAIKAAVERAGPEFVFVDYDSYFVKTRGRFCEGSTREPDANRNGLLFFEWDTNNGDTTLTRRGTDQPGFDGVLAGDFPSVDKRQDNPSTNTTSFEDQIVSLVREAKTANSSLEVALHDNSGADPAYRGRQMLGIDDFIPDSILRVFHPQPAGHAIIMNLLVWHIAQQQALLQDVPWGPESGSNSASCALP
ncbi:SGNH hydrolase-type esterase domain-containing protein [Paraphoma chrysanthemicola]|uniref:SGNH hydrolase-type esterase domain-containing protein n=1 Tax=Paraphoma chrysanthemicola TaxID=798071 RepID=A0A8K0W1N7_9PLEO|nr:SGNH hydrolase-type esterase domain-containing protein [Paraphoma chrysanthemicola]